MANEQMQLLATDEPPRDAVVQRLVASYLESYAHKVGRRPPERVLGQVAAQLKQLIAEGRVEQLVELALETMVRKALSPQLLPQLLAEAEIRSRTTKAREYVEKHGWPTGWSFRRSDHSGVYRRNVLGHDFPPGEKVKTPTLDEIQEAIERREEEEEGGGEP